MNESDKEFVVGAFRVLSNDLTAKINNNFSHVARRFDDMDKRLCAIESRLNMVAKDTAILPDIFSILEDDGLDIVKLDKRIAKLESRS